MKEEFMYFIWQSGGLFPLELKTVDGKAISIIRPGYRNRGEGPDFFDARIKIDDITWYGPIEFHLKTSDWDLHAHQNDPAYDNVILHIVMEHDREIKTSKGVHLPTLCLKNYVNPNQLEKYRLLEKSKSWIPCEGLFSESDRNIF